MRFETSKSTPPHLDRRLQLRMLAFVGLIGVIMFVMSTFQGNQKQKGKDRPLPGAPDPSVFQVNEQDQLKDDEFLVSPQDRDGTRTPKHREPVWQEPPAVDGLPTETRDGMDQEIARLETEFDRAILRRVKDNTIGILSSESDAYYRLLDHARRVSAVELEKAGATDVLYINLMEQPDRFRGEAVTIYGDLWRLYEFKAGTNDRGLKTVYEAWIFTADSEKHPYRVVFTHLPHQLEPGENLRKPVRVTGYFFKREGYASKGGMHVAPLLLANRIIPFRPPEAIPEAGAIVPYMIGIISAIGLAFLVTLASFAISDRRAARAALHRDLNTPRPSFAGIDVGPIHTVQDSLRQMEEEEWETSTEAQARSGDVGAALHARDRELNDRLRHQRAELNHEREAREVREREQAEREQSAIEQDQRRGATGRLLLPSEHQTMDRAGRTDQIADVPANESEESADADDDSNSPDWSYDKSRRRRRDRR